MKTIGIFSTDKKVGKTITAAYLSECLANLNKKVLLVDLDDNFELTKYLNVDFRLSNINIISIKKFQTTWDFYVENINNKSDWQSDFINLKSNYDYVIVDFPNNISQNKIEFLDQIDSFIVPIECEYFGLEKLSESINLLTDRVVEGFLITKIDENNRHNKKIIEAIQENFQDLVFSSKISRNYQLGLPVFTIDKSYKDLAMVEYLKLANEIVENGND